MHTLSNGAPLPSTWLSAPTLGPITFDSLYDGEVFNASLAAEWAGWDTPGFDAVALGWVPPAAAMSPVNNATVSSQRAEPIVVVQEVSAISAWATGMGATAFDFGRFVTGVLRVSLPPLPAGTVVTLRHAEILAHEPYGPANGSIYTGTLRKCLAVSVCRTVSSSTTPTPVRRERACDRLLHRAWGPHGRDLYAYVHATWLPLCRAFWSPVRPTAH